MKKQLSLSKDYPIIINIPHLIVTNTGVKSLYVKINKEDIQQTTQSTKKTQYTETKKELEPLQIKCPHCNKIAYLKFSHGYLCDDCQHIPLTINNQKTRQMKNLFIEAKDAGFTKMIENFKKMEQLDPNHPQLCLLIGSQYGRHNFHDRKMRYYQKALQGDQRDATIYNNLGVGEVRKKNYSKAIEYFLKAEPLILVHSFSESHTKRSFYANYAYALEKVGKSKEAFEYLKKAKDNGYENMLKLHFDMNVGISYLSSKVKEILKEYQNKLHGSNKNAWLDSESQKAAIDTFHIIDKMSPYVYIAPPSFLGTNKVKKNTGVVFTDKAMYMYSSQMNIGYYYLIYSDLPVSKIRCQNDILIVKCPLRSGGYGTFKVNLGKEMENVYHILRDIRSLYIS